MLKNHILFRSLAYLSIQHPVKRTIDNIIPFVLSALVVGVCFLYRDKVNFFGTDGLVFSVLTFIQTLPGFFIAALSAIIALGKNTLLDEYLSGNPVPTIRENGKNYPITRRYFLCLLFSFLTFESLLISFLTPIVSLIIPIIKAYALPQIVFSGLYILGGFAFLFVSSQLVFVTLFGLYYFSYDLSSKE